MFRIGRRKREDAEILWWFEIPATNIKRAQKFYEQILKIKMVYEENEIYKTAFFPLYGDHIGGSVVEGKGYVPSGDGSKIFLNAHPNILEVLNRVEPAGGKVLVPVSKTANGDFAWFLDPEGNKIALYARK